MKKLLLFLLLITFSFAQAQINTQVSDYNVCDTNSDGIAQFDLNTKLPEILGNENPNIHTITFHQTNFDAQFGANSITNPNAFTNMTSPQMIWARIINTQTSQLWVSSFSLIVNIPPNAGSDGSITACDALTNVINLFALITGEQPGGTWTRVAGTGGVFNAAAGTYTPEYGATTSIFTYTLTGTAPCINDTSVATVNLNHQPNAGLNGSITVCDTSTTPIDLYSLITNEELGGTWIRTTGVGGIFDVFSGIFTPSPNTTTSIFIYTINGTAPCFNDSSEATVIINSCGPNNCLTPTDLNVTNVFDTDAVLSWNQPGTSTNWSVFVVPFGAPAPTAASNGISASTNPFQITGLTPNVCYSYYVRSICSPTQIGSWAGPMNFCTYDCTNNAQCPERLNLVAFLDENTNGIKDANENFFNYGNFVYNINSGVSIYANSNSGYFSIFDSNPTNSYNLSFAVNSNLTSYYSSTSTYSNITLPTGSGTTTYYFPVTLIQPYNDLKVSLLPYGSPRPGFTYQNWISYRNNGFQNINGTITFVNNPLVTITSISQTGTTPTSNGFTYNFTNLAPNEARWFTVTMQVPTIPTVNLGDVITNSVTITPLTGDAFPDDNQMSLSQIVVGSYDPNDKTEAHGGKIDIDDFTSNDYLTYTIQFENTGTANAEFIRVEDFLDASLNPSSIEMLGSSHAYNMRRIGNQLIWNFYNINLPPTSINPTGSHGFIQFKIKPTAGFTLGDIIPNKAFIYFDYNPPIITNEFQTEFVQSLKTTDFDSSNFVLYPNPTNSNINVSLLNSSEAINSVEIHDLLGKKIKEVINSSSNDVNIDVSDLSKGVYLVQITTQSDLKITKKLIIQ